jgi:hypothetical protein
MSQYQERIQLDYDLSFHTLSLESLIVHTKELILLVDDEIGEAILRMTFEVDFETYLKIKTQQLFNLFPHVYDANDKEFNDKPIEIEACLRPQLLLEFRDPDFEIEPIAKAIFNPNQPVEENRYRLTESWLIQAVRQDVILPEDLAKTGTLKSGYTTLWNNSNFAE